MQRLDTVEIYLIPVSMSQTLFNGNKEVIYRGPVVFSGPADEFLKPDAEVIKGEKRAHALNL